MKQLTRVLVESYCFMKYNVLSGFRNNAAVLIPNHSKSLVFSGVGFLKQYTEIA